LVTLHTVGSTFVPSGCHASGLRCHAMAPFLSHITQLGYIRPRACPQLTCFEAGLQSARTEGISPAPEVNYAVRGASDAALTCREESISRCIPSNLRGHGHFDMQGCRDFLDGRPVDRDYHEFEIAMALAGLPSVA
jgi:tryptophan synthase beta chain